MSTRHALVLGALLVTRSVRAQSASAADAGLRTGEHNVVLNGVRVWYRVAGNAPSALPPLVFLHGGPGYNSHSFAVLAGPRLEPSLRVVYYDERGSGRSERPWTGHYQLDTLVEDVEALRRALGVPKIALMGHSFGGTLALAGREDYAIGLPQQRALASALPNARIVEFERAGHFLYLDQPERFTREVVAFLSDPR